MLNLPAEEFDSEFLQRIARFKQTWDINCRPTPESVRRFAQEYAPDSARLLKELVVIDFLHQRRGQIGEPVEVYRNRRFPEFRDDWNVILAWIIIESETAQGTRPTADLQAEYQERFEDLLNRIEGSRETLESVFASRSRVNSDQLRDWTDILTYHQSLFAADELAAVSAKSAGSNPVASASTDDGPFQPGQSIKLEDDYLIHDLRSARGGQKYVYHAEQRSSRQRVALKVVKRGRQPAPGMSQIRRQQLLAEGQIQALLDHQGIPPVFVIGPDPLEPTILVEKLIDGVPWQPRLPPFPIHSDSPEADLRVLLKVSRALQHAHSRGIIHRDLKPENVLLRGQDEVFLIDWGMALSVDDQSDDPLRRSLPNRQTTPRLMSGTFAYMAPEMLHCRVDQFTYATDVYLLGGILYQILSGTAPFSELHDPKQIYHRIAAFAKLETPQSRTVQLKREWPIPEELTSIAMRALDMDPEARFPNAEHFANAIEAYLKHAQAERLCSNLEVELQTVLQHTPSTTDGRLDNQSRLTQLVELARGFRDSWSAWGINPSPEPERFNSQEAQQQSRPAVPNGYLRAMDGERRARREVFHLAVSTGDLAFAKSQLVTLTSLPTNATVDIEPLKKELQAAIFRRRLAYWGGGIGITAALVLAGLSTQLYFKGVTREFEVAVEKANDQAKIQSERALTAEAKGVAEQEKAQKLVEKLRAETAEARLEQAAALAVAEKARENERISRAKIVGSIRDKARMALESRFDQGNARYLAAQLRWDDQPGLRQEIFEALQFGLVPKKTSSRRFGANQLLFLRGGTELAIADVDTTGNSGGIRIFQRQSAAPVNVDGTQRKSNVTKPDLWSQRLVLQGHTWPDNYGGPPITALAELPENQELCSCGSDGTIRLWSLDSGQPRLEFQEQPALKTPITTIAVEPGPVPAGRNRRLVTGNATGDLRWYEIHPEPNQAPRLKLVSTREQAHKSGVIAIQFLNSSQQLVSASEDGNIRMWDATGEPRGTFSPAIGPGVTKLFSLATSASGQKLAAGFDNGQLEIGDISTLKFTKALRGHLPSPDGQRNRVRQIVFTGEERLLTSGDDGTIREWDITQDTQVATRADIPADLFNQRGIMALAYDPQHSVVASAGPGFLVQLRHLKSGTLVASLEGMRCSEGSFLPCVATAFCTGQSLAVTSGHCRDAYIRLWDLDQVREIRAFKPEETYRLNDQSRLPPMTVAIHPQGTHIAAIELDGRLRIWDANSGVLLRTVNSGHRYLDHPAYASELIKPPVMAIDWSPDGKLLATLGTEGTIKLWDWQTGASTQNFDVREQEMAPVAPVIPKPPVPVLQFNPQGTRLLTCARDGSLQFRSLETGKPERVFEGTGQPATALTLNLDGRLMATGDQDGYVRIWDVESGKVVRQAMVRPLMERGRFSGRAYESDPFVRGEMEARLATIQSLSFKADSRLLALTQADGCITILDVPSGKILHRGIGHEFGFSPPGMEAAIAHFTKQDHLLTIANDGAVRQWDLSPIPPARQIEQRDARAFATSPDHREWALVTTTRELCVGNPDRQELRPVPLSERPEVVLYSPDGLSIVLGTQSGKCLVLDRSSLAVRTQFTPMSMPAMTPAETKLSAVTSIAVAPGSEWVASNRGDNRFDVWNLKSGQHLQTVELPPVGSANPEVCHVAFRPENPQRKGPSRTNRLAVSRSNGQVHYFQVSASGVSAIPGPIQTGPKQQSLRGLLTYSPDGQFLVQAGYGPAIVIWNADTGERIKSFGEQSHRPVPTGQNHSLTAINDAAFSRDGKLLATVSDDGCARLWDVEHGFQPVAVYSTIQLNRYRTAPALRLAGIVIPGDKSSLPEPFSDHELLAVTFTGENSEQLIVGGWSAPISIFDLKDVRDWLNQPADQLLKTATEITGLEEQNLGLIPRQRIEFTPPRP